MLLQSKDYYRAIAPPGYEWIGAGDLPYTHEFQTGNYRDGFRVLSCSEDCLTNGDLAFLAKHGMTCDKNRLKRLSARIARRIAKEKKGK